MEAITQRTTSWFSSRQWITAVFNKEKDTYKILIRNTSIKHDILRLVPKAKIYLRSRNDVLFAYLFGSYAINKISSLSDVDIAVYLTKNDFSNKKMDILGDLMDIFKTDEIDLVILNTAPLTLRMKILQKKCILTDNEPFVRHAYESLTIRSYFDFYKFEKSILERRFLNG